MSNEVEDKIITPISEELEDYIPEAMQNVIAATNDVVPEASPVLTTEPGITEPDLSDLAGTDGELDEEQEMLKKLNQYETQINQYLESPEKFLELKLVLNLSALKKQRTLDVDMMIGTSDTINMEIEEYYTTLVQKKTDEIDLTAEELGELKKFIVTVLDIKFSLEELTENLTNLDIKKYMEDAFAAIHDDYVQEGPSILLDEFLRYLERRMDNDKRTLIYELSNVKKLKEITANTAERIFKFYEVAEGKSINYVMFTHLIYNRNKSILKTLAELPEEQELSVRDVEPILIIFNSLFLRYIYKNYDFKKNILHKLLFNKFLLDTHREVKPEWTTHENELFNEIMYNIMKLAMETNEYVKDQKK